MIITMTTIIRMTITAKIPTTTPMIVAILPLLGADVPVGDGVVVSELGVILVVGMEVVAVVAVSENIY